MSDNRQQPQRPVTTGIGRGGSVAHGTDRAKNFKRTIKLLLQYLRPYWLRLAIVVFLAIGSAAFTIVGPKILGTMTDKIVDGYVAQTAYDTVMSKIPLGTKLPEGTSGKDLLSRLSQQQLDSIPQSAQQQISYIDFSAGRPNYDFAGLASSGLLLIVLFVLSAVFAYVQSWLMADMVQQITYKFRRDIAHKINLMPLKFFDSHPFGEILSRVTNDVDTVGQNLNQSLTQIITSVAMVIGVIGMMLSISWQLTLIALITIPISAIVSTLIVKRSQKYFAGQQATLGDLNGHIEEMFSGHSIIRAYNGEQRSIAVFNKLNAKLYKNAWIAQFMSGLLQPITQFVGNLGFVGVAVGGGWLAVQGIISIGDIQAFLQYVNQLNQPISQAANVANVLQLAVAAAERVFNFLEEPEESPDSEQSVQIKKVQGVVEFDHVSFGYLPNKIVIKNFTAQANAGQRIAIVGPTGAGKTTMVNLLMRFYDVGNGSIKIDGVDTRLIRRADVRSQFGMVLQDTWLFNGSVKDNIAYGKKGASMAEIVAAAKAAHVDHFIRALPNSYDMVLNENADNISLGEKQLITIARAMLANPPMLILDEATSSVDTRTEALIQKAMEKLMKGRTSFVIAHRLSTIHNADLILVMRDGNIVEQGTHQTLLAANGFYASLYNSQFTEDATV